MQEKFFCFAFALLLFISCSLMLVGDLGIDTVVFSSINNLTCLRILF